MHPRCWESSADPRGNIKLRFEVTMQSPQPPVAGQHPAPLCPVYTAPQPGGGGGGESRAGRPGCTTCVGSFAGGNFHSCFPAQRAAKQGLFFFSEGIKTQSALCPAEDGHLRGFYERRISADGRHAAFQTRAWHGPRAPTPGTLTAMGSGVATRSELPPSRKALLSL